MGNSKHVLIALLAVLSAGVASAQTDQGYYGEVGYSAVQIRNDGNRTTVVPKLTRISVGKNLNDNLSIEATYAFTVSKDTDVVKGVKYTGEATMYGAYLKPKMEVAKDVEAFVRVGALHTKYEDDGGWLAKTKFSYGAGVQAQFTKDVYGQMDYMYYYTQDGITAKGLSVSLGTRF